MMVDSGRIPSRHKDWCSQRFDEEYWQCWVSSHPRVSNWRRKNDDFPVEKTSRHDFNKVFKVTSPVVGQYCMSPSEALRIAQHHFYAISANNAFGLHVSNPQMYLSKKRAALSRS